MHTHSTLSLAAFVSSFLGTGKIFLGAVYLRNHIEFETEMRSFNFKFLGSTIGLDEIRKNELFSSYLTDDSVLLPT